MTIPKTTISQVEYPVWIFFSTITGTSFRTVSGKHFPSTKTESVTLLTRNFIFNLSFSIVTVSVLILKTVSVFASGIIHSCSIQIVSRSTFAPSSIALLRWRSAFFNCLLALSKVPHDVRTMASIRYFIVQS